MPAKVFFSFHYQPDHWRASQVRNMGVIEKNPLASDNDWESIKRGGDAAIQRWIDGQLAGRSCAIVLIGAQTAGRKWIEYEIRKAWQDGKGVFGIYIHRLKNNDGGQSSKGKNPFDAFTLNGSSMSTVVKSYDPGYVSSTDAYGYIAANLADWVSAAVALRKQY